MKEEEATLSNIDNQNVEHTQLEIPIVGEQLLELVVVAIKTKLKYEDNHVKDEEGRVRNYGNNEMKNITIKFLNLRIQLQISNDNNIYQQITEIDIEINELWALMNMMPKRRCNKKKKTTNHKV